MNRLDTFRKVFISFHSYPVNS